MHPAFFDRLDELLPPERSADATPSTADFILHELTSIIETIANDYEAVITAIPGETARVLVTTGILMTAIAVYVNLTPTGAIELYWLEIER